MSLRLRLIVAFFLLSVVPLGALTIYGYVSNVRALRQAAQHEAELLAGELSQRMQIVTAQLSERVEHLMDMSVAEAQVADARAAAGASRDATTTAPPSTSSARGTTNARARGAAATSTTPASAPAVPAEAASMLGDRYAAALGEVAMLLNNVELRGMYDGRGRGGRGAGGGGRGGFSGPGRDQAAGPGGAGGTGAMPPASSTGPAGAPALSPGTTTAGVAGSTPPPSAPGNPRLPPDRQGGGRRDRPPFPGGAPGATAGAASTTGTPPGVAPSGSAPSATGTSSAAPGAIGGNPARMPGVPSGLGPPPPPFGFEPPPDDPNRIRIDLRPIRDEMLRQMVPDGQLDKLTPEERRKVFDEINQRMLGFVQGIRVGAAELQKKADEAQRQAAESSQSAAAKSAAIPKPAPRAAAPVAPGAPSPVAPSTPAPSSSSRAAAGATTAAPAPPRAPSAPTAPASQRRTAITGSRMDVTVERDGQVQHVNAELNLDNLLGTVFSNTRRDRGEVPFAVSKDGHVYTPAEADRPTIQALGSPVTFDAPTGLTMLPQWVVVTTMDPSGTGLKFGIARPVGDSMATLRLSTARNAAFGLGFIGLALIGIVPLSGRLTRNLSTLSEGVRRIADGDYRARVSVTSKDEVGQLAIAFNQMAEDVEKHQRSAVEQERIKRELELGRQIQHEMLPHAPFKLGLMEIQGVSVPAREVGGDFFNYFPLPNGQVALLVGDVSGKGVGAALLMANIQASLRTRLELGQDLAALAREIDRAIESNTPGAVYATLFVGMLDPASRELRFVNAGHHPQYILRRGGAIDRMVSSGLPVGLLAGHGYSEQRVQLAPGEVLFFYTDGCVEAENASGDMFGAERLEAVLQSGAASSANDILARVELAVSEFRGPTEPFDDATMMAVKVG